MPSALLSGTHDRLMHVVLPPNPWPGRHYDNPPLEGDPRPGR
ncbi:MAG TPA: hypothetical protein VKA04_06995 [Pseudodesulfovibrio sp.]|nr:hypothetical protein [Pseudodesulfovibrio sp.]